jgi:hypothetical protein
VVSFRLESAGCVTDFAPHQTLKPIAGCKLTLDERVAVHRAGTHRLGALEIDLERIDARQRLEARMGEVPLCASEPTWPPCMRAQPAGNPPTLQKYLTYKKM